MAVIKHHELPRRNGPLRLLEKHLDLIPPFCIKYLGIKYLGIKY